MASRPEGACRDASPAWPRIARAIRRGCGFGIVLLAASICEAASPPSRQVPVEIRRGGDDGLTARFADELEKAFLAAPDFSLSAANTPGALIVKIPTNLSWRQIGHRTRVYFEVDFSGAGRGILDFEGVLGEWWADRFRPCAAEVVTAARSYLRRKGDE
jgi:hypothetical protein